MSRQQRIAAFAALLFAALALAPAMAHLLELPNKIGLPREHYLQVQQIYRGWALAGFLAIAGTQVVFWTWTYPANAATGQWTTLPEGWEALRTQWEYSHAASAVLNLFAFVALVVCLIRLKDHERPS